MNWIFEIKGSGKNATKWFVKTWGLLKSVLIKSITDNWKCKYCRYIFVNKLLKGKSHCFIKIPIKKAKLLILNQIWSTNELFLRKWKVVEVQRETYYLKKKNLISSEAFFNWKKNTKKINLLCQTHLFLAKAKLFQNSSNCEHRILFRELHVFMTFIRCTENVE